ncbi:MAG: 2-C-methyl-D-erythritol 4-phosphate cytidylyltransferase [Clostridiales bacterium]|jgi:2-C-methyl-D-erythritol 4-phosphate cytidylyltransferase|nr:2-C-methyl-D-erythritol 4-phosphate cytidylyltransferase [Clostridiales bacterium]
MSVCAVIAAAGKGERLPGAHVKQFARLGGRPMFAYAVEKFELCAAVDEIVIVTLEDYIEFCQEVAARENFRKVTRVAPGGRTRQESVYRALELTDADFVLVHDAARPFVSLEDIAKVAAETLAGKCCTLGAPVKDTVKICEPGEAGNSVRKIVGSPPRELLWAVQTPQGFPRTVLLDAHRRAAARGLAVTDDCALVAAAGGQVLVVPGGYGNIKITTAEDLLFAEYLLGNGGYTHGR